MLFLCQAGNHFRLRLPAADTTFWPESVERLRHPVIRNRFRTTLNARGRYESNTTWRSFSTLSNLISVKAVNKEYLIAIFIWLANVLVGGFLELITDAKLSTNCLPNSCCDETVHCSSTYVAVYNGFASPDRQPVEKLCKLRDVTEFKSKTFRIVIRLIQPTEWICRHVYIV